MMKNKAVKQMISEALTNKFGFVCEWVSQGDYLSLIAYEGNGYGEWEEFCYLETVSLTAEELKNGK